MVEAAATACEGAGGDELQQTHSINDILLIFYKEIYCFERIQKYKK